MHRFPLTPLPKISFPFSSTSNGSTPGSGSVAYVGLDGVTPARLEINIPAVSVCHQVSTIGHFFLPICSSYQCHASSLIGSPTVPSTLSESSECPLIRSNPKPIRDLIAVG